MAKQVETAKSTMHDLYQQAGSAKEVATRPLVEKIRELDARLDSLNGTDDALDQSMEAGNLERQRARIVRQIEDTPGTDKAALEKANAGYKQYRALDNVQKKVFKNPSVVSGDVKFGTPETVNVDKAIDTLKRLQTNRYGDQVKAAFGEEGTNDLFSELYRAQRMGVHAIRSQRIAKWIAGVLGASAGVRAVQAVQ
jgi:hypothetical protein